MIKQFHRESQRFFALPVGKLEIEVRNEPIAFVDKLKEHTHEWERQQRMSEKDRLNAQRKEALQSIHNSRAFVNADYGNEWAVYELCKKVYELAEIDLVDFNGASYIEKLNLIKEIIPFAHPTALSVGVMEYHESRERENWTMNYLNPEYQAEQHRDGSGIHGPA